MYAADTFVDNRLDTRRSVMSGRYLGNFFPSETQYERMLGQQELMQMLGKQRGYVLPQAPRVEYAKKEEEGNYQWKNSAPVPAEKFFAAMYNVSKG
jgi:hypothetical protein